MKLLRVALVVAAVFAATTAFAAEHSEGLLGLQITNGTADLYSPGGDGYISAYDHSEVGLGIQYWRLMSKDYAFTFAAGMGTFSETDKPGDAAAPGDPDRKYTQSSWNVRIGGDRAVKVGERAFLYFGPGLEVWSGKAKFEGFDTTDYESENVMRFGVSGRVGGAMMLSEKVGFNCQVGRYVGFASAEEDGAKANWWASGFQASGGILFRL